MRTFTPAHLKLQVYICTWFKRELATENIHTHTHSWCLSVCCRFGTPLHCCYTVQISIAMAKRETWVNVTHLSTNKSWRTIQVWLFGCLVFPYGIWHLSFSLWCWFSPFISFNRFHICPVPSTSRCNQHTKPNLWLSECVLHSFNRGNRVAMFAFFMLYKCEHSSTRRFIRSYVTLNSVPFSIHTQIPA